MNLFWKPVHMEAAEADAGGGAEDSATGKGVMAEHKAAAEAASPEAGSDEQSVAGVHFDSLPEWMDPQFYNEDTGMVDTQAMQKSQRDFRTQAKKNDEASGVPETAKEYTFDHADGLQLADDDPLIAKSQEAALKYGISTEAYAGFMQDMIAEMGEIQGTAEIDAQAELEKLGPNHERVMQDLSDELDQFVEIGLFGEADYNAAIDVSATAEGVKMLGKLIGHFKNKPTIPLNTTAPEGMMSKAELDAMVGTKEYNENPAVRAKVKDGYQKLFGKK